MAQYNYRAEKLKPLVAKANFTAEQLSLIHSMMRGCTMLRQGKVITSFLQCMLPDSMEIRLGAERTGKYGTYRPVFVAEKGKETAEPVQEDTESDD